MSKRFLPRLLLAVLAIGLAVSPAAAQYPPPGGGTTVSDTTVVPGQSVGITSPGWKPGSTADLDFLSAPVDVGDAGADGQGVIETTVRIPEEASSGEHHIRLTGTGQDGDPRQVRIRLLVLSTGAGAGGGTGADAVEGVVPFTGASVTVWMVFAIALFALGMVALAAGRRGERRRATQLNRR